MNKWQNSNSELEQELDEAALAQVHGGDAGSSANADWTTRTPYLEIRQDSIQAREHALDRAWDGLGDGKPLEIVHAARDWAVAKETQAWAEQNLNYINHREADAKEARERAEQAELDELERQEQEEQEKEDERLLAEADDLLRESGGSGPANQGDAGVPANAEPYTGEYPSFPGELINAPPPHEVTISIEPIDGSSIRFY